MYPLYWRCIHTVHAGNVVLFSLAIRPALEGNMEQSWAPTHHHAHPPAARSKQNPPSSFVDTVPLNLLLEAL